MHIIDFFHDYILSFSFDNKFFLIYNSLDEDYTTNKYSFNDASYSFLFRRKMDFTRKYSSIDASVDVSHVSFQFSQFHSIGSSSTKKSFCSRIIWYLCTTNHVDSRSLFRLFHIVHFITFFFYHNLFNYSNNVFLSCYKLTNYPKHTDRKKC